MMQVHQVMAYYSGLTPLHCVAIRGDTELCRWLIERGADRTLRNRLGLTQLMIARDKMHDAASTPMFRTHQRLKKQGQNSKAHVDLEILLSKSVD